MAHWQCDFNRGILASGKTMTRMAPKPSKTTTAWWPASNLTNVPLFMKCQINDQLTPNRPTQTGSSWGKAGRYIQLCSFTFFALHDLYSGPFSTLLAGGCPKVVILLQLPFAVEMLAQMGQITNTAWKNICGALAVQLQQWHPCEWQDYE